MPTHFRLQLWILAICGSILVFSWFLPQRASAKSVDVNQIITGVSIPNFEFAGELHRYNYTESEAEGGGTYDNIKRGWASPDRDIQFSVDCIVYLTEEMAKRSCAVHIYGSSGLALDKTSLGRAYGDDFKANTGDSLLYFRVGRVAVTINFAPGPNAKPRGSVHPDPALVDGLACGLEIAAQVQQQRDGNRSPKASALVGGQSIRLTKLISAGGTVWAPVSSLKGLGVVVAVDQKTGESTLGFGGKSLKIPLFSQTVQLDGAPKTLARPSTISRGEVFVPIKETADLLGIKVR